MTIPFELQMIHKLSGVQVFSHRFRDDIKLDPTLISGFVSAVINFSEELKPSEGKEMLKFIDRGDFVLQVEPGEKVIGLLILSSKDLSFKEKLKILVNEFEQKYQEQLLEWSGVSSCFLDFEEQVKQMISRKPLSPYHIPKLIDSDRGAKNIDDIKWAIIAKIDGQSDINSISEEVDLSVEVVQSIVAYFEEAGLVKTSFKISDESVFELTKKGLNALDNDSEFNRDLLSFIGEKGLEILFTIGTEKSLKEIKSDMDDTSEEIFDIIEKLVSGRYLEILPKWKLVLDKKAFQYTGSMEFIGDLFQLIFDESDNWLDNRELERLKRDTFALLLIKDESASKLISDHPEFIIDRNNLKRLLKQAGDLDKASKRLETLFKVLQTNIERQIGTNLTKDILSRVSRRLSEEYSELISQQDELTDMLNWLH